MKLGFFTAILPELPFEQLVTFAAENGFRCLEVACWPSGKAERKFGGVTHIDVLGLTNEKTDHILEHCSANDVAISALGYYPNPLDPDPQVSRAAVNHLKQVIRAARTLGLKNVNTFVGRDWTRTVDENWPRFLKVWKPLIAFAEDQDIRIGIENCPMSFGQDEWPGGKNLASSPVIWRRMFEEIPSTHFGLNYDPSHFILQQMDPLSPLAEFRDKFFHMHAKDMLVHQDRLNEVGIFAFPKLWHTPRIPGFGSIDWAAFIGALNMIGYQGALCVEVEDETFGKSVEDRKRALKVAGQILAPYF